MLIFYLKVVAVISAVNIWIIQLFKDQVIRNRLDAEIPSVSIFDITEKTQTSTARKPI